ncbi:MAG TPA: hypothetical protein VHL11_08465, partial [Phototrophicaceae bacterium]|nr:hypothetical protein [Phototrophicaceae bacterium]
MKIPQTKRQPFPLDDDEIRELLRRRHRQDNLDPFATDPDRDISRLGKIALRRNDINDMFALGDLCTQSALTEDGRLLIFYAGKAQMAYRRASQSALSDEDRQQARHIMEEFIAWVIDCARQNPT